MVSCLSKGQYIEKEAKVCLSLFEPQHYKIWKKAKYWNTSFKKLTIMLKC